MEELKTIMEKFAASGCDLDPLYKRGCKKSCVYGF